MLAIIIPYFKLTFFEDTLKSLSNQTDKRFNLYIGNDASPESPDNLLLNYKDKLDFLYKKFNKNLGGISLISQWNRCIKLSNNEKWLMILGDDDVLHRDCIASFYKELKNTNKINLIRFSTIAIDENGLEISKQFIHPKKELSTDSFFRKLNNETRSSLSEYIFNRKAYEKHGFFNFPLAWYSDDMAWLQFTDYNEIYSINKAIVYFRISSLSISGSNDNLKLKGEAKYQFYKYITLQKLKYFSVNQKLKLLITFETITRKRGEFNFYNFFVISAKYLQYLKIYSFYNFIKRTVIKKIK